MVGKYHNIDHHYKPEEITQNFTDSRTIFLNNQQKY